MKYDTRDVVRVPLQGMNTDLILIIPHLQKLVISTGNQKRFIRRLGKLNCAHPFIMSIKSIIWERGRKVPNLQQDNKCQVYFNCSIQGTRSKNVGVFGIKNHIHDIVGVSFKFLI